MGGKTDADKPVIGMIRTAVIEMFPFAPAGYGDQRCIENRYAQQQDRQEPGVFLKQLRRGINDSDGA